MWRSFELFEAKQLMAFVENETDQVEADHSPEEMTKFAPRQVVSFLSQRLNGLRRTFMRVDTVGADLMVWAVAGSGVRFILLAVADEFFCAEVQGLFLLDFLNNVGQLSVVTPIGNEVRRDASADEEGEADFLKASQVHGA